MSKAISLTTLNEDEFAELLLEFDLRVVNKLKYFDLKGRPRTSARFKESIQGSLLGSKAKLEFMLIYLAHHPTQKFMGHLYQISQSKVSEWFAYLLPILEGSLSKLGVTPKQGERFKIPEWLDNILCDVTERQVCRSNDYEVQKLHYSGKKKMHTVKNLAFTDSKRYIHYLSSTYEGSIHDKTILDDLKLEESPLNILADLGFMGADKEIPNIILPYKKPKNAELSGLKKEINKGISSLRVVVEHAFAGVKRLKITTIKTRLKSYNIRHRIFVVASAIHNLRVKFRNL